MRKNGPLLFSWGYDGYRLAATGAGSSLANVAFVDQRLVVAMGTGKLKGHDQHSKGPGGKLLRPLRNPVLDRRSESPSLYYRQLGYNYQNWQASVVVLEWVDVHCEQ